MSKEIKELVKRLRKPWGGERLLPLDENCVSTMVADAADALESLAGEVALVKSAHARLYRDHEEMVSIITAERDRLRAAGRKILAKLDHPTASVTQWDADELRAALGDAS